MSDGYHTIAGVDHFALGKRHATPATRNAPREGRGGVDTTAAPKAVSSSPHTTPP